MRIKICTKDNIYCATTLTIPTCCVAESLSAKNLESQRAPKKVPIKKRQPSDIGFIRQSRRKGHCKCIFMDSILQNTYWESMCIFWKAKETLIVFTIHNDVLLCIQCIEGWYFRFSDSTKMPHSTHHPKDVFYVFRKVVSWDRTLSLIGRKDFRKCDVFKM